MPTFICLTGDVQEILIDDGAFPVTDAQERTWYCLKLKKGELKANYSDLVLDMIQAQKRASKQGLAQMGTTLVEITCKRDALRSALSNKKLSKIENPGFHKQLQGLEAQFGSA